MANVLSFPARPCPRLHVLRAGEEWELHHEGRNGDSWALLERVASREAAISAALDALPLYPGAMLGEVQA